MRAVATSLRQPALPNFNSYPGLTDGPKTQWFTLAISAGSPPRFC